jgi:hypothetical protein
MTILCGFITDPGTKQETIQWNLKRSPTPHIVCIEKPSGRIITTAAASVAITDKSYARNMEAFVTPSKKNYVESRQEEFFSMTVIILADRYISC